MMLATGSSRTFRYLAGKAIGLASAPVSAPASVMVVPSRGQYSRRTMWPPHFEEPEETKEGIKKLKDNEGMTAPPPPHNMMIEI